MDTVWNKRRKEKKTKMRKAENGYVLSVIIVL